MYCFRDYQGVWTVHRRGKRILLTCHLPCSHKVKVSNTNLPNRRMKYYNKDYNLSSKIGVGDFKNYLRICDLRVDR